MVQSRSFIAVPPGATIKEQLEDRGISQKEFASRMGMSEKHISQLINGQVRLTSDGLLRVKDLAHVNVRLGLFVRVCQLPEVAGYGADADHRLDEQLCF